MKTKAEQEFDAILEELNNEYPGYRDLPKQENDGKVTFVNKDHIHIMFTNKTPYVIVYDRDFNPIDLSK